MGIVSQPFLKSHASTLVRDYGYIANPDVTIISVRGYAVDYTVSYELRRKSQNQFVPKGLSPS
jgi:hypothetical protein